MNRALLAAGVLLASATAQAAPFVVSDPLDPSATHCGFKMDAQARTDVPVALSGTDKICRLDVAGLSVGSHVVNATTVATDAVWGRRESPASANFTFSVPAVPGAPSGLGLKP